MAENPFEARLDRLFAEYADGGIRPFDKREIAAATVASASLARLSPHARFGSARLALVAAVLLVALGGIVAVGARLLSVPAGVPGGLLVLAADGITGTIRVFRPDGDVVADVPGSMNGCDRLVVSADGRRLAWVFANPPVNIVSLDGPDRISVPQGQTSGGWAFSPDRTRVAYLARNADGTYALTIASLLDGSATVIARGLEGVQISPAAWSVSDTLALSVTTPAEVGVDVIDADGSHRRPLVRLPLGGASSGIGWFTSWSPDGRRLAYARDNELPTDAAVFDLDSGRSIPITTAGGDPVNAWTLVANSPLFLWTPDGQEVAYMDGPWTFLDVETHEARLAPDAGWSATHRPFWAPDGTHVAFMNGDDPARLAVLAADLSNRVDLVADGPIRGVAWSPDGRRIAVGVGTWIELLDPTGAEPPTRILNGPAVEYGCLTWWSVDDG